MLRVDLSVPRDRHGQEHEALRLEDLGQKILVAGRRGEELLQRRSLSLLRREEPPERLFQRTANGLLPALPVAPRLRGQPCSDPRGRRERDHRRHFT